MTETATRTRVRRTPAEIAQADLDAAKTRKDKAFKALGDAEELLKKAKAEYGRALQLVQYAAQHPDLPGDPTDAAPRA